MIIQYGYSSIFDGLHGMMVYIMSVLYVYHMMHHIVQHHICDVALCQMPYNDVLCYVRHDALCVLRCNVGIIRRDDVRIWYLKVFCILLK